MASPRFALRQPVGLVVMALVFAGCAHTQTRSFDASSDARAEVNARASQGHAVLTLATGERIASSTLRLDAQDASWTDERTGEPHAVSLKDVQAVRVHNRRSFVLRDLGIGLATGAATGLALGSLAEPNILFSRQDHHVLGLMAGSILGAPIGALIGYEQGQTEYILSTPARQTSRRAP